MTDEIVGHRYMAHATKLLRVPGMRMKLRSLLEGARGEYVERSYKVFTSERKIPFYEMEYFIPSEHAREAFERGDLAGVPRARALGGYDDAELTALLGVAQGADGPFRDVGLGQQYDPPGLAAHELGERSGAGKNREGQAQFANHVAHRLRAPRIVAGNE